MRATVITQIIENGGLGQDGHFENFLVRFIKGTPFILMSGGEEERVKRDLAASAQE